MLSDPLFLSGARDLVSSVSRRLGFSEQQSGQIALAVDEALCNVIRHGYDRRADRPIVLCLWPEGSVAAHTGVRIVIEDEGKQVDPAQIRGRSLDDIRPGGLGVHIIREVMDEVLYEKRDAAGMRLTMVKKLDGKRASPGPASGQTSCCAVRSDEPGDAARDARRGSAA
jgi:anti-sigma regulatory factor (Ser/Thr protein kinase)